jgi:hypothetical protein
LPSDKSVYSSRHWHEIEIDQPTCLLEFQSLFSWNLPSDSAEFSSFFLFLVFKPAFSHPTSGMNGIYQILYKFIPAK